MSQALARETYQRINSGAAIHAAQDDEAGLALDQDTDRGAVHRPLDEVALPVPGQASVLDGFGAMVDAQILGNEAGLAGRGGAPMSAFWPGLPEGGNQSGLQRATGLGVEGGADGLVTDEAGASGFGHAP